jgi:hypothetical protein
MVAWGVVLALIYFSIKADQSPTAWFKTWPTEVKPRPFARPTIAPDLELERAHPRPSLRPRTTPAPPVSARVAVQAPIAATPSTARAPVVVTVSTQTRLSALAALRRLGFSHKDAQAQLDTTLGLAIQQSLLKG